MQYYFVEYQRALRAIRIALILLGVFLACVIILRISVHTTDWTKPIVYSPTAHVTSTHLADGSTRIVFVDPKKQTHGVIVRHPDGTLDADIFEPRSAGRHNDNFSMGSMNMNSTIEGNARHTTMRFHPEAPTYELSGLFLATLPMGLIVASLLGGLLAKENDGHLELAWTKPVSRERYATAGIVVDAVAIVATQLLTIAVTLVATLMFFVPRFTWPGDGAWYIAFAVAAPIAWYALITAASASLKRGPGAVVGLGWVVALLIPGVAVPLKAVANDNYIAAWFYAIFHALSYIDPIAYLSFSGASKSSYPLPLEASVGAMCALIGIYSVLAIAQWRRVEA
ncbi:MAG TPA: hypothetical protein VIO32_08455 [Candidatus Baltobacteraceae bacterium]